MHFIFLLLALVCEIGGVVCSIIILIEAFQDEVWKGLVCLLCGLYGLYYMIFEFEHENKWGIVLGSLCGWSLASAFGAMAR